jgi:hypothetical protein
MFIAGQILMFSEMKQSACVLLDGKQEAEHLP